MDGMNFGMDPVTVAVHRHPGDGFSKAAEVLEKIKTKVTSWWANNMTDSGYRVDDYQLEYDGAWCDTESGQYSNQKQAQAQVQDLAQKIGIDLESAKEDTELLSRLLMEWHDGVAPKVTEPTVSDSTKLAVTIVVVAA